MKFPKLPFVSRGRYEEACLRLEEMRAQYETRLTEVTRDLHKWQDRFAEIYTLKPIHEKEEPITPPAHVQYGEMTEIDRARLRVGPRASIRTVMNEIQREHNREYEREQGAELHRADEVTSQNHGQIASFDVNQIIEEGRAAAHRGNA